MSKDLDLKSIWNKGKENTSSIGIDLSSIKQSRTKTDLYWVRIILLFEFWITSASLAGYVIYSFFEKMEVEFLLFYIIFCAIYLTYYRFLINKIESFQYDRNVKDSLTKIYRYLRFYLLHYKVMLWISAVAGFAYAIITDETGNLKLLDSWQKWLIFLGITIGFVFIILGFFHLIIHLLYGRKVNRLKKTIDSLER